MKFPLFSESYSRLSPSFLLCVFVDGFTGGLFLFRLQFHICFGMMNFKDDEDLEKVTHHFFHSLFFAILLIACAAHQIMTALTCRPLLMIVDYRFISTVSVQLMGCFGCVGMACALGSMVSTLTPLESSERILVSKTIKYS
jgi:hypothetical protein